MKNKYEELRNKQEEESSKLPLKFAFSNEQFEEGMRALGLEPSQTDKIYKLSGTSGFYRRTDSKLIFDTFERLDKELEEAIEKDEGFIKDMFKYELANHEYGYTRDLEQTLVALNLTGKDIRDNENLAQGLREALEEYGMKLRIEEV